MIPILGKYLRNFQLFSKTLSSFEVAQVSAHGRYSHSVNNQIQLDDLKVNFKEQQLSIFSGKELLQTFSTCWLRDNCTCANCYQRKQKSLIRLEDHFKPKHYGVKFSKINGRNLKVIWEDSHESEYDLVHLKEYELEQMKFKPEITKRYLWNVDRLSNLEREEFHFNDVISCPQTMKALGKQLIQLGFCHVVDAPVERKSLNSILNLLGGTLSTLFSESDDATMDLTNNDLNNDLGWSDKRIPPHTDFTYYYNPSALVGLHLLEHEGTGGDLCLVDGFHVVEKFRRENPGVFRHLVNSPILWKYISHDSVEKSISTIVRLQPDTQEIEHIRWSPMYLYPLHGMTVEETESFYNAIEAMYQEVHINPDNRYHFIPKPGLITLFDNWRMIHERCTGFTGKRVVHCGDVPRDSWVATARKMGLL